MKQSQKRKLSSVYIRSYKRQELEEVKKNRKGEGKYQETFFDRLPMMVVMLERPVSVQDEKAEQRLGEEGGGGIQQDDYLESTRAQMGEVKEENERLKTTLAQMVKDYQSLKMHFFDIVRQPEKKSTTVEEASLQRNDDQYAEEPAELVSLSLGIGPTKERNIQSPYSNKRKLSDELTLGLDSKPKEFSSRSSGCVDAKSNLSSEISFTELKEKEEINTGHEPWPPSKSWSTKNMMSREDEMISQQTPAKRARVSVRARCGDPTIYDGCQWRKYGQKIAKGNPCPRAYYRCSIADGCPVRKQVQRCAEDNSILITTYEGTHNHPLPSSATAMASTTSAAACMLMSGSTSSNGYPCITPSSNSNFQTAAVEETTSAGLHGLSSYIPSADISTRPKQIFVSNPPSSSSLSHPTITLDLTTPKTSSNFTITPGSSYASLTTGFSFSSLESSTMASTSRYGAHQQQNMASNQISRSFSFERQKTSTQSLLTDSIAKAITSDPSFQTALAAAITSYVGVQGLGGDAASGSSGDTSQGQGNSSTFLKRTLSFSGTQSASASPVNERSS